MMTCTSAQLCHGLLPDCSIGVKTGSKGNSVECICSTYSTLLPADEPIYTMSLQVMDSRIMRMYGGEVCFRLTPSLRARPSHAEEGLVNLHT